MVNFIHPAPGSRVSSNFGWRRLYAGAPETWHQGIDYAKSGNVPILASADGVVKQYIGDKTSYGNVLFIEHNIDGKLMTTTYAHLKSKAVKAGDKVKQGQLIGIMGNTDGGTGVSTGQHLHFEIHDGKWVSGQRNAVNPALYVDKENEGVDKMKELEKHLDALAKEVKELKVANEMLQEAQNSETIAPWAADAFDFALKSGITQGTKDGYKPNRALTRQEAWKMLHSLYKFIKGEK